MPWIDGNGNIYVNPLTKQAGIGVEVPAEKLHVEGNILAKTTGYADLMADAGAGYNAGVIFRRAGTLRWAFQSSDGDVFLISNFDASGTFLGRAIAIANATGNVGIGANVTEEKLTVTEGNLLLRTTGDVRNIRLNQLGAVHKRTQISFEQQGNEQFLLGVDVGTINQRNFFLRDQVAPGIRLFVDPEGNVGIGKVDPGAKLDVAGDIKSSGLNIGGGFYQDPDPGGDLGLGIDENGTISTNGNLRVLRSDDASTGPTLWYLGRQEFQGGVPKYTNYFFWQSRENRYGWYWSGWNTFRHPLAVKKDPDNKDPSVEWGYGYYPFRNMAKNHLLESDGKIVTDNEFYGPIIYFQNPEHIDVIGEVVDPNQPPPRDIAFKTRPPSGYDSDRHPYLDLGSGSSLAATASPGATQITVQPGHPFTADDEIFIDEQSTEPKSEINEVLSVSGNILTLKRDVKGYSSGKPVRKVRELGAVQPDRSTAGLAIYIRKSGNDLVFQDNTGGVYVTLQQIRQHLGL